MLELEDSRDIINLALTGSVNLPGTQTSQDPYRLKTMTNQGKINNLYYNFIFFFANFLLKFKN